MTFVQFFLYFIGSQLIYNTIGFTILYARYRIKKYRLEQDIKNGKVSIMTFEDLFNNLSPEDKKTWN